MTSMPKRRVLVIEDSLTVRKRLVEVLARSFDVVGEAADGQAGIELCERLRPDVVTMDMMMPRKNGVEATEHIMAYCPTPILIVSASMNRGELFRTYDALAAGAVDVLEKPLGNEPDDEWERRLIAGVERVARIRVITHPRLRLRNGIARIAPQRTGTAPEGRVVAIGTSTGGPRAVLAILKELPEDFALPILLVIHIAEPFGTAFADWLDGEVALTVRYAREGELVGAVGGGTVLIARPGFHMQVRRLRIELTSKPERHSCRPSVDVLFESVAHEYGARGIGCLLTGMGKDGAAGLGAIRTAGGMTIAQDAATSVVFGMPGEAVKIGAAVSVLPLSEIAPTLLKLCEQSAELRRAR